MTKDDFKKMVEQVEPLDDAQADQDVMVLEGLKSGSTVISKAVDAAKELIAKSSPDPPEQKTFSFLPTAMTRISPFFPMSRRELKDRPFKTGLSWETSWGRITVESGNECLSITDETVMLAVLEMIKRQKSFDVECSAYEIGKIIHKNPNKRTYETVWRSLNMLMKTIFKLEVWEGKGKNRKPIKTMAGNILTFIMKDHSTNRLDISMNPFFGRMFAEGFITGIDMRLRARLKGDVAKALYRFFQSQRGYEYSCHFLTIAWAINLNVARIPNYETRRQIRKGLSELKREGFLKRWTMPKDVLTVWKSNRPTPKD
jgi:hypothetical protein